MKEDILLMHKLLEKTMVSDPLDGNMQDYSLNMKRKNFVSLTKKIGMYSSAYGAILSVYFLFKKLGIGLTIVQSAGVLCIATVIAVTSIGAGGFIAVKKYVLDASGTQEKAIYGELINEATRDVDEQITGKTMEDNAAGVLYSKSIGIQGFANNGANEALVTQLSDIMRNEFSRLNVRGVAIISSLSSANYILSGSVDKLDNLYQITVKLVHRRSGRIVFASSEESNTPDGLKVSAKKIAKEISERL
jgi:hypothetical protein